jgi:hypothetical protein
MNNAYKVQKTLQEKIIQINILGTTIANKTISPIFANLNFVFKFKMTLSQLKKYAGTVTTLSTFGLLFQSF